MSNLMSENSKPNNTCNNCLCGCVGYAYVPIQELINTYGAEEALQRGSLFPELDLSIDEYGTTCKQKGDIN